MAGFASAAAPADSSTATPPAPAAAGAAGGYTVDTTASAAQINAANLATYRAVVFVNSAGDVLDAAQETDLANYVNGGGGFVGIHGTNRPDLIPGRVSHGCIRMRNRDILRLSRLTPVGTPVTIQ